MKKVYGVKNFTFKSLALGLQYQALDSGAVRRDRRVHHRPAAGQRQVRRCSRTRRTSSASRTSLWSSTRTRLSACPALLTTVNSINKLLTTPAIIAMNKAVAIDHQQPAAVAASFLKANGLG